MRSEPVTLVVPATAIVGAEVDTRRMVGISIQALAIAGGQAFRILGRVGATLIPIAVRDPLTGDLVASITANGIYCVDDTYTAIAAETTTAGNGVATATLLGHQHAPGAPFP